MEDVLESEIGSYLEKDWDNIVADIERVVRIESTEDLPAAAPGAPFGPGPRAALTEALNIARDMGFEVHDVDGYVGYADLPGESDTQIGIIGHVDVVPAGPGWTVEPFAVTRREGYLMGRGVIDDKGPIITTLHAVKFWLDKGEKLPYTIRIIFGANEETGMDDVPYYRERFADPAFLFTPDAEFPVSYGEKGLYDGAFTSKRFEGGVLVNIEGGAATNAVPGLAHAIVRADAAALPQAAGIVVTDEGDGTARIDAHGKAAHASLPHLGVSAIDMLVAYLLENDLLTADERAYFELVRKLTSATDGSKLGIKASDEHFGELTVVGGTISMEGGCVKQTLDCRFPTTIAPDKLTERLGTLAAEAGATYEATREVEPFLIDPDSGYVQALLSAYNEATGEDAKPFTQGGGTYARKFSCAASFGPEMPWVEMPEWAGGMHGPDETVPEDLLKQAFKIYALTIARLMELDL